MVLILYSHYYTIVNFLDDKTAEKKRLKGMVVNLI